MGGKIQLGNQMAVTPSRAYADSRLQAMDLHLLNILSIVQSQDGEQRRDGWINISQDVLAVMTGMHRTTINRCISRLEGHHYLAKRDHFTSSGGRQSSAYQIIFNASLPTEFDRWSIILDADGCLDLPYIMEKNRGGKTAETLAVAVTHTPVAVTHRGEKTAETLAVAVTHTPVAKAHTPVAVTHRGEKTAETLAVAVTHTLQEEDSNLESSNLFKDSRIQDSNLLESEFLISAPDCKTEALVNFFIAVRKLFFPDGRSSCSTRRLLTQANDLLATGLAPAMISKIIIRQMTISDERDLDPPAGISRFKREFAKHLDCPSDQIFSRHEVSKKDVADLDRLFDDFYDSHPDSRVWLDCAAFTEGGKKPVLAVISTTARDIIGRDILPQMMDFFRGRGMPIDPIIKIQPDLLKSKKRKEFVG